MFGLGKGKDKDEDPDFIDDTGSDKPIMEEKSEFRLFLFVIMSALIVLFVLGFIQGQSTVNEIRTYTNVSLSSLNKSAEQTLYVIENNSNQTDMKINNLTNATTLNADHIANNTANIDLLFAYIKNLVETEMPKEEAFEKNITDLIILDTKVANKTDKTLTEINDRLALNITAKNIETNKIVKDLYKIIKNNGGVVINSNNK